MCHQPQDSLEPLLTPLATDPHLPWAGALSCRDISFPQERVSHTNKGHFATLLHSKSQNHDTCHVLIKSHHSSYLLVSYPLYSPKTNLVLMKKQKEKSPSMLCNTTEWLGLDISFTDKERDIASRSHSCVVLIFYVYQEI